MSLAGDAARQENRKPVAQAREHSTVAAILMMTICRATAPTVLFLALISHSFAQAQIAKPISTPWFANCDQLARKSSNLKFFLDNATSAMEGAPTRLGPCFLLNQKELIYFDNNQGTNFAGLFYVNIGSPNFEPQKLTSGFSRVEKEFVGVNRKRYAWITSSWGNSGISSYNEVLLYLVPKTEGKVFKLVTLFSDADDGCIQPEKPADVQCVPIRNLHIDDGTGRWINIRQGDPQVSLGKPKFFFAGNAIAGFERNLLAGEPKTPLTVLRYRIHSESSEFLMSDLDAIEKAVRRRVANAVITRKK